MIMLGSPKFGTNQLTNHSSSGGHEGRPDFGIHHSTVLCGLLLEQNLKYQNWLTLPA